MAHFALTGAAGYIAPRHLQAIRDTGSVLVAAVDPHDSVGILDSYFPDAAFFTEFERFDRHLEKLRREGPAAVDYVSVCSPNHLHDAHIRLAMRVGADALCEKPLVVKPHNLDQLESLEREYGKRVYTLLQLRVHPALIALREQIQQRKERAHVVMSYVTSRGTWYKYSWKGDESKSGGIGTNIGIHFFDLLMWFFGTPRQRVVHVRETDRMAGYMELENADVSWFLSVDQRDLPESVRGKQTTYRSITVNGEEVEFSGGFRDLHTEVYARTLEGKGFGIPDARPSIELVYGLRFDPLEPNRGERHPFLRR